MAKKKKKKTEAVKEKEIKFGTDGWRGVMARDFTFDNVRRVAQAIAEYFKNPDLSGQKRTPPVVVGFDRRFQSDAYAEEIAQILDANDIKTTLAEEVLPTPALSYLSKKHKSVAIMVTASHNPPSYNGIKIKLDGRAATEVITKGVEECIDRANPMRTENQARRKSFRKEYLAYIRSQINPASFAGKLKKKVVVDYLYGASGGLMGEFLKGNKLVEIHAHRDPLFGGLNPEPIEANLAELKKRVLDEKALIGIALDGDGDRIAIVDDKGRYLTPCQIFPMIIEYLVSMRKVKGKIVQSVSMGYLAERVAKAYGLEFEQFPVGFKHVAEQLGLGHAAIGGEESGGYAWKGAIPERDGLLTGLLFLEMCAKTKKTPSQLWELIEKKYGKSCFQRVDYTVSRAVTDKEAFVNKVRRKVTKKVAGIGVKEVLDIDGAKVILENGHWVLVRPSGTEPLVRCYAESDSPKTTQALLEAGAKWVNAQL